MEVSSETSDEFNVLMDLPKVLTFATGASEIPPMWFLWFESDVSKIFSSSSTCGLTLTLPLLSDINKFQEMMDYAFINSPGFHKI